MEGHDPGGRIRRVQRKRAAEDQPREVAGPDVDELAGPRPDREIRGVIRLQPLAGQNLATVDQLRRRQPHGHALGSSSALASSLAMSVAAWPSSAVAPL